MEHLVVFLGHSMIIMIDNYDSFTYNLVQYLSEFEPNIRVFRNDEVSAEKIKEFAPDRIVISPGPGKPQDAGISRDVLQTFFDKIPVLGVCLGYQIIAETFGGKIIHAPEIMHGKTSLVFHEKDNLFSGIPSPFEAMRYHSLVVERKTLPNCFEIIAETKNKTIMAVRHKQYSVWGVQFHPESILTECGKTIIKNFLSVSTQ